jgi:hypothetical protein
MQSTFVANTKERSTWTRHLPGATESLSNYPNQIGPVPQWPPGSRDSLDVSDLFNSELTEEDRCGALLSVVVARCMQAPVQNGADMTQDRAVKQETR